MNRIEERFRTLKARNEKALIAFMTAGDPSLEKDAELIWALEKDGVDVVELGVPFSDPLADGPVIQASSFRSLKRRTNLRKILALVKKVRRRSQLPILLMSYLNPVLHYGAGRFARDAKTAGVDGLIVPDLPPEEGGEISSALGRRGLDLVYLAAPTSTRPRQRMIASASRGFLYFVSLTGLTGSTAGGLAGIREKVRSLRGMTDLPVCVGFGISTPAQARALAKTADGVIIGSALVKAFWANRRLGAAAFSRKFLRPFARALGKGV